GTDSLAQARVQRGSRHLTHGPECTLHRTRVGPGPHRWAGAESCTCGDQSAEPGDCGEFGESGESGESGGSGESGESAETRESGEPAETVGRERAEAVCSAAGSWCGAFPERSRAASASRRDPASAPAPCSGPSPGCTARCSPPTIPGAC